MKKQFINAVLGTFLLAAAASPAAAVSYGVEDIFGDGTPANVAIGKAQFFIDVTEYGSHQVLFTFRNDGPLASSITKIYFEEGSRPPLCDLDRILYLEVVDQLAFREVTGEKLGSPAGGANIGWANKATEFEADPTKPTVWNGIGPGESLGLVFDLSTGFTFDDVTDDLNRGVWRIGFHAQGFPDGNSDAFVLGDPITSPSPVPDTTSTLLAFSSSLIVLLGARRKFACGA